MINSFLNALVLGIETGCIYAVIALGLSIIFGVIRVVNFAHGTILMLSLYLSYFLFTWFKIEPYLSAIIAAGRLRSCSATLSSIIVVRPIFVREKAYVVEPLGVLMLMAGVDMILSSVGIILFTPYVKSVRSVFSVMTAQRRFLDPEYQPHGPCSGRRDPRDLCRAGCSTGPRSATSFGPSGRTATLRPPAGSTCTTSMPSPSGSGVR